MRLTDRELYTALNSNPLAGGTGFSSRPLTFGKDRGLNMRFIRLARQYDKKLKDSGFEVLTAFEQELQLTDSKTGRELLDDEYADFIREIYCRLPALNDGRPFAKEVNHVAEIVCPPLPALETSALFNLLVRQIRCLASERKVTPVWHRSDINISVKDVETGKHILDHREHDERAGHICGLIARAVNDAIPVFIRRARFENFGLRLIDAGMTRIRALRLVPNSMRLETRLDHNPLQGQHMIASMAILLGAIDCALTLPKKEINCLMDKMISPTFHNNLYWFDDDAGNNSSCFFFREILNGATVHEKTTWNFDLVQIIHYNKPQFLQREMGYKNNQELTDFLSSLRIEDHSGQPTLVWSEDAGGRLNPNFIDGLSKIQVRHPVSRFYAHRMNKEEGTKTPDEMIEHMRSSALLKKIMGEDLVYATLSEVRSILGYEAGRNTSVEPQ